MRQGKDYNPSGSAPAPSTTARGPQLSAAEGVPTDVSSLALDRELLMASEARERTALAEPSESSDAQIMLRVKTGDDAAFDLLVRKYRRPIIHFMYRSSRNQAAAEDLAQEVFLLVYRSRQTYEASAKFTTWLYRIATNLAVNHARDTKYERPENVVSVDETDEETGTSFELADASLSVEQNMVRRERLAAIRSKVMALPERQRMAVLMHKYQAMDYKQIGEVLKLSESATKSLLFRAYQTLRDQLKEFV